MTKKQTLFVEFMLKRIGFKKDERIKDYINKLVQIHGKWLQEERKSTSKNGYTTVYDAWIYTVSPCIEELMKEVDIKKQLHLIKEKSLKTKVSITATDLANFDFCPASYSISKSFEIEFPTNEHKTETGLKLHESLRLLNRKIPKEWDQEYIEETSITENTVLKKIKECKLIFSGHDDQNQHFKNERMNYKGQPDYIFQDPNGNFFVVEEKFKYLSEYYDDRDKENESFNRMVKKTFHSNHIVQLLSYLNYIEEYELDYGVLIYWFYDYIGEQPYIHHVSTKVIKSDYPNSSLETTYNNLTKFIEGRKLEMPEAVNPNKCAACVVNKYCSHKTGEKTDLNYPYDKSSLQLEYVEFPEELRKDH